MVALPNRRSRMPMAIRLTGVGLLALLCLPGSARAGKLSWLDEVVQQVVAEAKAGGRVAARGGGCRRDGRAGGGAAVRPRGRRGAGDPRQAVRRPGEGRQAGGAALRGAPAIAVHPPAAQRPGGRADVRDARPGRTPAGGRDGRDRPAPGQALPRAGRDDDPQARHRGAHRHPGLRRRRGRGDRQGRAREPGRPPQDRARRLELLHARGPAPQEEAGRRRGARRLPGQPREVRRLRGQGHRVRRPRVRQGRRPARGRRRRRGGAGARSLDRRAPGLLRPRCRRVALRWGWAWPAWSWSWRPW